MPFGRFFDALVLLHRRSAIEAVELLVEPPEGLLDDAGRIWRAWYACVWAEAAGLARQLAREPGHGRDEMIAAAAALRSQGARYPWTRTLATLDGDDQERARSVQPAELTALGATAMAWPPPRG